MLYWLLAAASPLCWTAQHQSTMIHNQKENQLSKERVCKHHGSISKVALVKLPTPGNQCLLSMLWRSDTPHWGGKWPDFLCVFIFSHPHGIHKVWGIICMHVLVLAYLCQIAASRHARCHAMVHTITPNASQMHCKNTALWWFRQWKPHARVACALSGIRVIDWRIQRRVCKQTARSH